MYIQTSISNCDKGDFLSLSVHNNILIMKLSAQIDIANNTDQMAIIFVTKLVTVFCDFYNFLFSIFVYIYNCCSPWQFPVCRKYIIVPFKFFAKANVDKKFSIQITDNYNIYSRFIFILFKIWYFKKNSVMGRDPIHEYKMWYISELCLQH